MKKRRDTRSTPSRSHAVTQLRRRTRIGIIGAGSMGQALIRGLCTAGVGPGRLVAVEADRARRQAVAHRYAVRVAPLRDVAMTCRVILVAVKPQDLGGVLRALRDAVRRPAARRSLVISIAAGVTTKAIERILGRTPVVRVMPNLAAKVGSAVSALTAGRWARASDRAVARAIFESVGEVVELPERCFDAVTAISGSGPAYFFLIFKALRDAGVAAGLPRSTAQELAVRTALGSADLTRESRDDLEALIAQVASKRGTTEAALLVFRRRGLSRILQDGIRAAVQRSRELSRVVGRDLLARP